ncbi:MAG: 50S ribosomal protein L23 [Bacteroidota bacterium]|nr:50S ribosomal protein L23 [Bacteroidota bacterium]
MNVLLKPIVTEKMTDQGEKLNRYGFIVDVKANKVQIKQAIEGLYDVKVLNVNTMRYDGKLKTRYTKTGIVSGRTNAYKKAIVSLDESDAIDFYSNI